MSAKDGGQAGRRGPYAKSEERRRSILDAAHAVFAAKGYSGGSLQDVADHASMSQTSLLHHFPSKRELLMAVLERRDEITGAMPADAEEGLIDGVIRTALFNESIPSVIELYTVLCAESVT
ncbi:TetR/AcrR family transcriptional regulator [Arthrobacter glacialis]|uniref:TetR/AcrR family transcriptional regulator n=1 Tax=Arthrobacter glacialis TaxID=1664 RepID=UPI001FAEA5E6|nr:helix-turn-helix domain-containing protein [Arthrobacter glacialis]